MPDVTFASTYNLVKNKKNNSDQRIIYLIKIEYINLQELIHNAIKIKIPIITVKKYIQLFVKDLGKNMYIEKLTALTNYVFNNHR